MKILHVVSSLDPVLGGLAACVKALTPELIALGHASEVACLDRPGEPFLAAFPGLVHALGRRHFGYGYSLRLTPWLRREASRFDVVIVHGLWQFHGWAVHRVLQGAGRPPYFVFTHGMLDPWFQREYPRKHAKKKIYWALAERRVLRDAAAVLFTCEEERKLARISFGQPWSRECVVAFGTAGAAGDPAQQRAAFHSFCPAVPGACWLFLGRIHPKKGVDLLIDAYATIAAQPGARVPPLVIAGPCADERYLRELQERAAERCPAGTVHWPGMITGDVKWGALRAAEVFVLASHQENFGIAVAEALSCGTPVLISDKVNIWREIEMDAAGLVAPDTTEGAIDLFRRWVALDPDARAAMRLAATQCFDQRFEIRSAARSLAATIAPPAR